MYQSVRLEMCNNTATVWLCRSEVSNAFDALLIAELKEVFLTLSDQKDLRVVILRAEGKNFCAGADIKWMKESAQADWAENEKSALLLSDMFTAIAQCRHPTVAVVQGLALGGGAGLVAACDMAIAMKSAVFSFTEVRLGLVPAVIAPYVLRAIGAKAALRYFQTAERINADQALRLGLVSEVADTEQNMIEVLMALVQSIKLGAPNAQYTCKKLIHDWQTQKIADLRIESAQLIAGIRSLPEAQQGLGAFFEKKQADWVE